MAKQELVTVELIKNPSVKRQMTVASAKFNSRKWRITSEQQPAQEKKKADANHVVAGKKSHDDLAVSAPAQKTEKDALQAEYFDRTGNKPDGRWNESKLKEKIAELNAPTDEVN